MDHAETILESIRDGVYMLDPAGHITYVNDAALEEHDIGYTREELLDAHVSILLGDEDLQQCLAIIEDLLADDERDRGRCEIDIVTADGRTLPCELQLTVLEAEDGSFEGTVGVVRDITERKRREQRLDVLHRVLRHNLRNDLNVILGRTQLLQDELGGESETLARSIREKCEEIIQMNEKIRRIQQIRDAAEGPTATIPLRETLETLVAEFRESYPAGEFRLSAPADVHLSVTSREVFDTAVRNLLENAVEHTEGASPRVDIDIQAGPDRAEIHVRDNGPGVPKMEREVLAAGSESPLKHSNGVGLWLVYWSVTAARGEIRVEDAPDGGTVVTLSYPTADATLDVATG